MTNHVKRKPQRVRHRRRSRLPMRRRNFRTRVAPADFAASVAIRSASVMMDNFVHGRNANVNRRRAKINPFRAFGNFRLHLGKRR